MIRVVRQADVFWADMLKQAHVLAEKEGTLSHGAGSGKKNWQGNDWQGNGNKRQNCP
jgi:hypothetical protein